MSFSFVRSKKVFFEYLCAAPHVLGDLFGQGALFIDRPLKGYDDRHSEITEQADKVLCIRLDFGSKTRVRLRQEETLDIDDQAPALIGDNSFGHRRVARRQSRISTAKPLCTTEDISEYALLNGAKILCNALLAINMSCKAR
jgi:hypothetical protein